jgi:hypothetical protein
MLNSTLQARSQLKVALLNIEILDNWKFLKEIFSISGNLGIYSHGESQTMGPTIGQTS